MQYEVINTYTCESVIHDVVNDEDLLQNDIFGNLIKLKLWNK